MPSTRRQSRRPTDFEDAKKETAAAVLTPTPTFADMAAIIASLQHAQTAAMERLLDRVLDHESRCVSSSSTLVPTAVHQGNFAHCTARFGGAQGESLDAFLDAVEAYKECTGISEINTLKGLSILLTGQAAVWWLGVKATVESWREATIALRGAFDDRRPPHQTYVELFRKHQEQGERTERFVAGARALLARLPPGDLSVKVQLDMVYGLLTQHIRERLSRDEVNSFEMLLRKARDIEDSVDVCNKLPSVQPIRNLTNTTPIESPVTARETCMLISNSGDSSSNGSSDSSTVAHKTMVASKPTDAVGSAAKENSKPAIASKAAKPGSEPRRRRGVGVGAATSKRRHNPRAAKASSALLARLLNSKPIAVEPNDANDMDGLEESITEVTPPADMRPNHATDSRQQSQMQQYPQTLAQLLVKPNSIEEERQNLPLQSGQRITLLHKKLHKPVRTPQQQPQAMKIGRQTLVRSKKQQRPVQIVSPMQTQPVLQNQAQMRPLEQALEPQSAKMLIFLQNGVQRLITFALPKESCTLQEVLEQVNIPFTEDTHIQCMQNTSSEIDYFVSVGSTTRIEEMLENHPMLVRDSSRSSPNVRAQAQSSGSGITTLENTQCPRTGVKPFSCSLCAKSFTNVYHLESHLNTHKGSKL